MTSTAILGPRPTRRLARWSVARVEVGMTVGTSARTWGGHGAGGGALGGGAAAGGVGLPAGAAVAGGLLGALRLPARDRPPAGGGRARGLMRGAGRGGRRDCPRRDR